MKIWTKIILAILIFLMIAVSALVAFLGSGDGLHGERPFDVGYVAGRILGSIALPFIVLAGFQFFERFRNEHARWRIVFWSALLFFFLSLNQLAKLTGSTI